MIAIRRALEELARRWYQGAAARELMRRSLERPEERFDYVPTAAGPRVWRGG